MTCLNHKKKQKEDFAYRQRLRIRVYSKHVSYGEERIFILNNKIFHKNCIFSLILIVIIIFFSHRNICKFVIISFICQSLNRQKVKNKTRNLPSYRLINMIYPLHWLSLKYIQKFVCFSFFVGAKLLL